MPIECQDLSTGEWLDTKEGGYPVSRDVRNSF